MTVKKRLPICLRCEFGYPIELIPDYISQEYVCPCCGHRILFKDWILGDE